MKKYNIGLDVGTESVGWAVVDNETNKLIRKGNKNLWGVNLFDAASTAEARRMSRSTRRRYERRRKRINILQKEFREEIKKIDKNFYTKLNESFYNDLDEINKTIKIIKEERDSYNNYLKKYPTIYHLRDKLINDDEQMDIRLVYLAIHHIIKYRGNFLYSTDFKVDNIDSKSKLKEILEALCNCDNLEVNEDIAELFDYDNFEKIISIESKKDRRNELKSLFKNINANSGKEIACLIVGDKFDIAKLFNLELEEKLSISFKGNDYDEKYNALESVLNDKIEILELFKDLYNIIFLKQLFKNSDNTCLSSLMVNKYNEHKKDLKYLKEILRNDKEVYKKIFKGDDCEYNKYINNKYTFDEFKSKFVKDIENILKSQDEQINDEYNNIYKKRIENELFLPRITDTDNGKYPYQLNKDELIKIIEKQGKYYPFLMNKIDDTYRLVKLLEFRIPYYVGPLNNTTSDKHLKNKNAWVVKRSNEIITPYNFDKVIDLDASAEEFIKRMISHCTYLLNEYAMPAESILYSKFKVMNELKQIKVNTNRLSIELQNKIINELFMKRNKSITNSEFISYLSQTIEFKELQEIKVTGYSSDKGFANNMKSYCDFFWEDGIFKNTEYQINDAEEIIEWITIFEDKKILERKLKEKYTKLDNDAIKKVLSRKYKGWSSLSKKLLNTKYYEDKKTKEFFSILDLLEKTDENFMQIINNDKYKFQKFIDEENNIEDITKLDYSVVSNLATSPSTKKGIYQTLKVIEEIVDYMGYEPSNITLEMARGEEEKKRTDRRKDQLIKLYETSKKDIENYKELMTELNSIENFNMKYFLYFIQEGKSLYSGKRLDIDSLNEYEIDHIIPRTLVKDNSIDNLALVLREENQKKGASLVLPKEYRNDYMIKFWNRLKENNLITPKKFYRLTRKEYSDEDIEGFINRQLVETRQITKHVANIVSNFHKKTKVIYINAGLTHNYREKFDLFKFRNINDFHHAQDAYLAAVIGKYRTTVYGENFDLEKNKKLFYELLNNKNYKELNYGFVINSLSNDMKVINEDTGELIFDPEEFNRSVENTLYQNDVIVTRKSELYTGEFFQQTKNKKGCSGVSLKSNLPTELYGSYTSLKCSYMCLVEYKNKKKLIGIPYLIDVQSKMDISIKNNFIKSHLKLKEQDAFKILKDRIPFNMLIIYKNHKTRLKGYSIANKNGEIANDIQFTINKDSMKKWKYTLNRMFNMKNKLEEIDINTVNEILAYIMNKIKNKYPLYLKVFDKVSNRLNESELSLEEKVKLIKELLNMLRANSMNANLKFLDTKGLDDRVGRLSGISITEGTLIYQSTTGLKHNKYEF